MARFVAICISVICLVIFFIGCSEQEKVEPESVQDEPFDSVMIELRGQTGRSVFDVTLDGHDIDYIGSALGNFVNAIDSLEINSRFGWLYSVNGHMGEVASDKFITHDTDIVRWHYRKF